MPKNGDTKKPTAKKPAAKKPAAKKPAAKKPTAKTRKVASPRKPLQVDPGFVYKLLAFNGSQYEEVGHLFQDEDFAQECWSMKGAWESKTAATRKPGGIVGDQSSWHTAVVKMVPCATKAVDPDSHYPTGSTAAARAASFFTNYPAGTGGKQYTLTVT